MTTPTEADMEKALWLAQCRCGSLVPPAHVLQVHEPHCRAPAIAAALAEEREREREAGAQWLEQEDLGHDPDDLYTGRTNRAAAFRARTK